MLISSEERTARARAVLVQRGMAAADMLAPEIAASWTRCLEAGLDPRRPPPVRIAGDAALRQQHDRHQPIWRLAQAEMRSLHQQIAGTNFLVSFAAPDGMVLEVIADPSFGAEARAAGIRPGAFWTETLCGTNALGTVAAAGRAVTVHGGEHFFSRFGALTCSAVPIFAPDATLAGVLDASSDCRSRQQHTRALVGMAATQIENELFRQCHAAHLVIAFHSRAEYLRTLSTALLAVSVDGMVLGANPQARLLLQGLPAKSGSQFEDLFRSDFASVLRAARHGGRCALTDRVGSTYVACADNPPPLGYATAVPRAVAPAGAATPAVSGFVSGDPGLQASLRRMEAAAARGLPILLCGPTGSGKEHLARHAHTSSGRRGAFVAVNCAALPASLIEAELFGHAEGAFSGARRGGAAGLAAQADRGTLFLDEIGEMPLPLQSVLLRLLEDWMVRPVGGSTARHIDVLLVAASNVDLATAALQGRFRADLLHRLNTVEIRLPQLRLRTDFADIARYVLAQVAPSAGLTQAGLAALAALPWPGNVRELRNVLTRLTLLHPERQLDADIADELGAGLPRSGDVGSGSLGLAATASESAAVDLRGAVRERIRGAVDDARGNVSLAARRLGVSRNTVYRALAGNV